MNKPDNPKMTNGFIEIIELEESTWNKLVKLAFCTFRSKPQQTCSDYCWLNSWRRDINWFSGILGVHVKVQAHACIM